MKKDPTVVDVLKRMRSILRKGWTQKEMARNAKGQKVRATHPEATEFCLAGAQYRALADIDPAMPWTTECCVEDLIRLCVQRCGGDSVVIFNDAPERKKSEVIAVVTCAIEKAQKSA